MTFWKATIHPHKYAKSQLSHELIAFKNTLPKSAKSRFGSERLLGVKKKLEEFNLCHAKSMIRQLGIKNNLKSANEIVQE
jgi:hypothetical protein